MLLQFKMVFMSIFFEALPFVLLGALLSAFLQVYIPDRWIARIRPKHTLTGIIMASLIGVIFPICECGVVPLVRGLIRRGFPIYMALVFIMTAPIINPVVYLSTAVAFRNDQTMATLRMVLAFTVALVIGYIFARTDPKKALLTSGPSFYIDTQATLHHPHEPHAADDDHDHPHDHDHDHDHDHPHDHHHNDDHDHHHMHEHHHMHDHAHVHDTHDHAHVHGHRSFERWTSFMQHAVDEFFDMSRFLILGALFAGVIQTFVARETLSSFGHMPVVSNVFMMGFSYLLSACTTSDAFIAASFSSSFAPGALLSFLVFGPMLHFRNTLLMLSIFKREVVWKLLMISAVLVYVGSVVLTQIFW